MSTIRSTADFVLEGPDIVQAALIITDKPQQVLQVLREEVHRGVTRWEVKSGYSGNEHTALYCTVTRPEINTLKNSVAWADEEAFVIILRGHEAIGRVFQPQDWTPPAVRNVD